MKPTNKKNADTPSYSSSPTKDCPKHGMKKTESFMFNNNGEIPE
jgi:hypothetical protein